MARLGRTINDQHRQLLPMLWRFDQLDRPRWRQMALREAGRAAMIALAMSPRQTLSAGVESWLTDLTVQQHGAPIAALLLIGDESWTISLQQTAAQTIDLAAALAQRAAASTDGAVRIAAGSCAA